MYNLVLGIHIILGIVSVVGAPLYIASHKKHSHQTAHLFFILLLWSSLLMTGLGVILLLMGAQISRTCATLGFYSLVVGAVFYYGNKINDSKTCSVYSE